MTLFGAPLGLLFPGVLFALPLLVGALVYAYLKRGRGRRVPVPTLLILKAIRTQSSAHKKFIPPPRFFFELLLLALLALGSAGLYREGSGELITLIIDNSFSTLAKRSGTTVFDRIQSQARAQSRTLPPESRFSIWTVSPTPKLVNAEPVSARKAAQLIDSIAPAFGSDNLADSVQQILRSTASDKAIVFSDLAADPMSDVNRAKSKVKLRTVTQTNPARLENVALTGVSLSHSSLHKGKLEASLKISAFTGSDRSVKVFVSHSEDGVNWRQKKTYPLTVKNGTEQELTISNIPSSTTAMKIELDPGGNDSIVEDNIAWVSTKRFGSEIPLISELSAKALGLDSLSGFSFKQIRPADYTSRQQSGIDRPKFIIFHRVTPERLPDSNALFVYPPSTSKLFKVQSETVEASVTSWLESHPLTTYANVHSLVFSKLAAVEPPGWGTELIRTTQGPAAFAGEVAGKKYAVLGFELFPFEGRDSPTMSILTLNLLKWLSGTALGSGYLNVYSSLEAGNSASEIKYVDSTAQGPASSRELTKPGLLSFSRAGSTQLAAINFFDKQESNTLSQKPVNIEDTVTDPLDMEQITNLAPLLAALVLLLLLADIAFTLFSRPGLLPIRFGRRRQA